MLKGDPIFANSVTHVEIDDEAAGEFVLIKQIHESAEPGEISVENGQWEAIKAAVEQLLSETQP